MGRDGGYLWNCRNSWGNVRVKGKPSNVSKASGRCKHAKCRSCHKQPVSKAKAKTKGRNKRALSKLLAYDDWPLCKLSSARRLNTALSVSSCSGYLQDVDEYACELRDACHAVANLTVRDLTHDDDLGADDAGGDKENVYGDVISDVHAHDCVEDAAMHSFAPAGSLQAVMMRFQVVYSDCFPNPWVAAINENGSSDRIHGCHAMNLLADDGINAALGHAAGDVRDDDDDDDAVHGVGDSSAHAPIQNVIIATQISDTDDYSLAKHVKMLHATDAVSDNDDAICDDGDDHDASSSQSLIPGLVNVDWPEMDKEEDVSDNINSEEDSLCGDWCHVACSDALDEWYLC